MKNNNKKELAEDVMNRQIVFDGIADCLWQILRNIFDGIAKSSLPELLKCLWQNCQIVFDEIAEPLWQNRQIVFDRITESFSMELLNCLVFDQTVLGEAQSDEPVPQKSKDQVQTVFDEGRSSVEDVMKCV